MLHIAICDDEKDFVQYLTDLLNQYSKETGRNIKITPYYDGMELIEKYDPTIDLIFLDIQMKMVDFMLPSASGRWTKPWVLFFSLL